jgi:hypothetical protein
VDDDGDTLPLDNDDQGNPKRCADCIADWE